MSLPVGRDVVLRDFNGNVLAGFWQYGSVSWNKFRAWLNTLILTREPWAIFGFDEHTRTLSRGERYSPSSEEIVPPGTYILLQEDRSPINAFVTAMTPRQAQQSIAPEHYESERYVQRTRDRDGKCLVTGLQGYTWSRLEVVPIFPLAHTVEWERYGYHLRITDPVFAGSTKIKSVQNMILMRKDLHEAWINYEFSVDPDDNYRVTAFINGLRDIDGLTLSLDHIKDPTRRPLDDLFRDHFKQGLLKYVKRLGEPGLEDLEDLFESFDLESQPEDTPYPHADEGGKPNASGQDNRVPVAPAVAQQGHSGKFLPEDIPYPNADEPECGKPRASGQDNRVPVAPAVVQQGRAGKLLPEDTPYPNAEECGKPKASGQDKRVTVAPAVVQQGCARKLLPGDPPYPNAEECGKPKASGQNKRVPVAPAVVRRAGNLLPEDTPYPNADGKPKASGQDKRVPVAPAVVQRARKLLPEDTPYPNAKECGKPLAKASGQDKRVPAAPAIVQQSRAGNLPSYIPVENKVSMAQLTEQMAVHVAAALALQSNAYDSDYLGCSGPGGCTCSDSD